MMDETYSNRTVTPNDALIIWNRSNGYYERMASFFEKHGAKVIVMENPYIRIPNKKYISIGLGYHNNLKYALLCLDNGERFASFGIEVQPWRTSGEHVLITTQSKFWDREAFGYSDNRQPDNWDSFIIRQVRVYTDRKILYRTHPKSQPPAKHQWKTITRNVQLSISAPAFAQTFQTVHDDVIVSKKLEEDLKNAWCTILHSSNAATESLIAGIPVIYTGNNIFMQNCASTLIRDVKNPAMPDNRLENLNRMAWNQFSIEEIGNGLLFDILGIK